MISNTALHFALIRGILNTGYAPTNANLARHFNTTEIEVEKALYNLAEYHGVVLHPHAPKVWVIHPFSLAPTNFYVTSLQGEWWGNCAWCSLGIAALLNTDVTITTTIGAEGKPQTITIENGAIRENNLFIHFPIPMKNAWDNVVYTCSTMLVFENEQQIDTWSEKHLIPKGDIQPIQHIWEFSKKWYGKHADSDWKKWTMDEAKQLFAEFDLSHRIWNLGESTGRF